MIYNLLSRCAIAVSFIETKCTWWLVLEECIAFFFVKANQIDWGKNENLLQVLVASRKIYLGILGSDTKK